MVSDALPSTLVNVPVTLSRVASQLAAGSITCNKADDFLLHVLGLDLWAGFPEDHSDALQDSWSQLFDSWEAERDQAANSGACHLDQSHGAGPSGPRGGTTRNSPDPKGNPQQLAREALAQAEKH